jgi:A/G-specific adenine glycosylase
MTVEKNIIKSNFIDSFRSSILHWYDTHHRTLPWRAPIGQKPEPYHVWLSEIMLQQTTVPTVIPYFLKFIGLWPTLHAFAKAPQEDILREWAGLGYYARARNLHKCAQVLINEHQGVFPQSYEALKQLPGIGDYTASAIMSIAFDKPSTVVDGNVERIMARVFEIKTAFPEGKKETKKYAQRLSESRADRPSDYAQSLMDLGSMVCTPTSPKCGICPVSTQCGAYKAGKNTLYPIKALKKERPKRYGAVFWITDKHGNALFEKRPDKGLLGGMMALPTSAWEETAIKIKSFKNMATKNSGQHIRHVFTHFELRLDIYVAKCDDLLSLSLQSPYTIYPIEMGNQIGLPTVFKKAYLLAKDSTS